MSAFGEGFVLINMETKKGENDINKKKVVLIVLFHMMNIL